jgi:hypothetical protein
LGGQSVEATLQFEKAGTAKIEMPVVAMGAAAPGVTTVSGTMMMQGDSKMHSGH